MPLAVTQRMQTSVVPAMILTRAQERVISELDDVDQLVKRYRGRLLRFVTFSIGDQDLAESIVQDCFVKAYAARASFRGDCSVQSWLTRIALNMVKDHQRTQKFQFWRRVGKTALDVTELASAISSPQSSPETQLLAHERAAQVGGVIQELSLNQRTVFLLRFHEEMGIQEISSSIGMPVATVKTHLHRAVKAVREKMGDMR